eukprot:TRINITY_DN47678_c0_g1_i1.p1 TRINITY_DN47678_c0_g1~~TRINITY_DN47678_c0_g1_i1.p1  ORF type:complete len:410 (+),score=55.91 TRINITY_DN47678_c0_g1_i1:30-1259(+)
MATRRRCLQALALPGICLASVAWSQDHWVALQHALQAHAHLFPAHDQDSLVRWRVSLQPLLPGSGPDTDVRHFFCVPWATLTISSTFTRLPHELSLPVEGESGNCTLDMTFAHPEAAREIIQAWVLCGKGHVRDEVEGSDDLRWGVTLQALDTQGKPLGKAAQWTDSNAPRGMEDNPERCMVSQLSSSLGPDGLRRPPQSMQDSVRLPLVMDTTEVFQQDSILQIAEFITARQVVAKSPRGLTLGETILQTATTGSALSPWHVLQQPGRRACVDTVISMMLLDLGVSEPLPGISSHLKDTVKSVEQALRPYTEVLVISLGEGANALEALEAHLTATPSKVVSCAVPLDLPSIGGHAVLFDAGDSATALWLRDPFHGMRVRVARQALVNTLGTHAACIDVGSRHARAQEL